MDRTDSLVFIAYMPELRSLEVCARRKLNEKTGVDVPYLEQLGRCES